MCTLIILYKLTDDYPILVAANRDESYTRKSVPPGILSKNPFIWGGKDLEAGGTWLGLNQKGLLVGITNRVSCAPYDRSRRSRGLLCLEALSLSTAVEVKNFLEEERPERYNPFNLLYVDSSEGYISYYRDEIRTISLTAGVYILTNQGDVNDLSLQRTRAALNYLDGLSYQDIPSVLDSLKKLCGNHPNPSEPGTNTLCIHGDGYGTVSSSIVALGYGKYLNQYFHTEGKPCLSPYQDYSSLLGEIEN
jgi:uncharacterized protein with NRDE domain